MKATTKPVEVEAVQWRGDNEDELIALARTDKSEGGYSDGSSLHLYGPDLGHILVRPNGWLVRTANLGVSAMRDEEFRAGYDLEPESESESEGSD